MGEPTVDEPKVEPKVVVLEKPKRILTEAQLLALKKGREALAEKRKAQKEEPKKEEEEQEYPGFCTII
jgi:hypothetical protein